MNPKDIAKMITEDPDITGKITLWHGAPIEALQSIQKHGIDSSIKPFHGYSNVRTYWAINPNETQPAVKSDDFLVVEAEIDADEIGVPWIVDKTGFQMDPNDELEQTRHLVGDRSIDSKMPMKVHEVFVPRSVSTSEISAIYVVENGVVSYIIGNGKLRLGNQIGRIQ
jgi:hypothetical protein